MFEIYLFEVPHSIELEQYLKWEVPLLDQGAERGCTSYALATVVNYLLRKHGDDEIVSPRWIDVVTTRHKDWPDGGSNARSALKAWQKHGISSHRVFGSFGDSFERFPAELVKDASLRPLAAYYRVNHQSIYHMQSALTERGIIFVTAFIHLGWQNPVNGHIVMDDMLLGLHAFAIVAYDPNGFWIQNSWGRGWGADGLGLITYDDWLINGTDAWIAVIGAPLNLSNYGNVSGSSSHAHSFFSRLRPHVISTGENGTLNAQGIYGTTETSLEEIFENDVPRLTQNWEKKRLLFYFPSGWADEEELFSRIAQFAVTYMEHEIYLLTFDWYSNLSKQLNSVLHDSINSLKGEEKIISTEFDFMMSRLDDTLEPLVRANGGKAIWDEVKVRASRAAETSAGGIGFTLKCLDKLLKRDNYEVHVIGDGSGSLLLAKFVELLTKQHGQKVESCTLLAPTCTLESFKHSYLPAIIEKKIKNFSLFTLGDHAERSDNIAGIYNKSFLYLVSNALEAAPRVTLSRDGVPILGMEKFLKADQELHQLFTRKNVEWILAPNSCSDARYYSTSQHHRDFGDDGATFKATMLRILGTESLPLQWRFRRSRKKLGSIP
jgi:hypothetical protein